MVLLKTNPKNPMKLLKHPENNSDENLLTDDKSTEIVDILKFLVNAGVLYSLGATVR